MFSSNSSLPFLFCAILFGLFGFGVQIVSAGIDTEFRMPSDQEVELQQGAHSCPLPSEVLTKVTGFGQVCPDSNELWYFTCCGENAATCCFRLQSTGWVILCFLSLLLIGCVVLQCICGFLSCICRCVVPIPRN